MKPLRFSLLPLTLGIAMFAISTLRASAAPESHLKFFYCIQAERPCKETTPEAPVASGHPMEVARRALVKSGDFIGFTDAEDTTLQFKLEDGDSVLVDLPNPKLAGSYSTHLKRAQALKLIDGLSPPLARYRSELKLKFAKW
jgi:hypothetical protein